MLGAHNIRQQEPSQVRISVESFRVHEGYDSQRIANDIAVLKLSEPAPLNGMNHNKKFLNTKELKLFFVYRKNPTGQSSRVL